LQANNLPKTGDELTGRYQYPNAWIETNPRAFNLRWVKFPAACCEKIENIQIVWYRVACCGDFIGFSRKQMLGIYNENGIGYSRYAGSEGSALDVIWKGVSEP